MGDKLFDSLASIAGAVIGLAIIAVLVSRNANTSSVISSAGTSFSQVLSAAEAPVSGGMTTPSLGITGGSLPFE